MSITLLATCQTTDIQIELALLAMFTIKFRPVYLGIAKSELDHFRRNIYLYEWAMRRFIVDTKGLFRSNRKHIRMIHYQSMLSYRGNGVSL